MLESRMLYVCNRCGVYKTRDKSNFNKHLRRKKKCVRKSVEKDAQKNTKMHKNAQKNTKEHKMIDHNEQNKQLDILCLIQKRIYGFVIIVTKVSLQMEV